MDFIYLSIISLIMTAIFFLEVAAPLLWLFSSVDLKLDQLLL